MPIRPAVTALVLAALVTGVFWTLRTTDLVRRLELTLLDARFVWRSDQAVRVDPSIALIEFDERSYRAIERHPVFWLGLWGRLAGRLLDNGATVVGLDVIPTHVEPAEFADFARVAVQHRGKLVLIAALDGETLVHPADEVVAALGAENLALANLTRDFDGVARSQAVQPLPHQALGRESWPFLAALLAERQAGVRASEPLVMINYQSRSHFPSYRLEQVLEMSPEDLRRAFAGKAVLVGTLARSDQDLADTPFSLRPASDGRRHSMPGLWVQAFTLNTLLTGQKLLPVPPWVGLGALFLANLALALAATFWRAARVFLVWLVVSLGALLGGYLLFALAGRWLELAPIILSQPLCLVLVTAARLRSVERERIEFKRSIERFVAPEVLDEMLADPGLRRSQLNSRRVVTVLFSDINDFSTVCEVEDPVVVARMLDEHYQEMSRVIFAHRGTIIRFVGDQFMVLFGAPQAHPNPAQAALQTGVAMVERCRELAQGGKPGFYGLKVGIHTGEMLLATIGNDQKSEYTAVGDNANQGARIQDLTKKVGVAILASQATVEAAGPTPGLRIEDQGEHPVKGRVKQVRVYAISREGA